MLSPNLAWNYFAERNPFLSVSIQSNASEIFYYVAAISILLAATINYE
jgi:hypothetical protein